MYNDIPKVYRLVYLHPSFAFCHHITNSKCTSVYVSIYMHTHSWKLTQRMATTQLRLLRIILLQLRSEIVQQLQITLFRVLSQCLNESPTQGSSGLSALECIGAAAMSVLYLLGATRWRLTKSAYPLTRKTLPHPQERSWSSSSSHAPSRQWRLS